ncbi:uncharacterized protein G2W53_035037 [Senna tora]|uniref:Uncharacterized protein n=1 Tax=Senna tora TaxID=362788 RepID=A0A834W8W1_9FABA|nr:uncharacterized protein G2W53_035037 [Senna tora]
MESAMYPKHTVRITEWVSGVGNREQRLDLGEMREHLKVPGGK